MTTLDAAVRAELLKLWTLRVPVVVATSTVALVALLSWGLTHLSAQAHADGTTTGPGAIEPAVAFLTVLQLAQAGVIFVAAWIMAQEHDGHSLRTSLVAVPRRGQFFGAKVIVALTVSVAVSVASVLGAWGARCAATDCSVPFSGTTASDLRVLGGVVLYHALLGVLTLALCIAVRQGVLGLCVMLSLVLVVSPFATALTRGARFLPDQAGAQLYQLPPRVAGDLGPQLGGLVLLVWTLAAVAGAMVSLRRWSA